MKLPNMPSDTEKIIAFVQEFSLEQTSREVLELAKRSLLDSAGVMTAGARQEQVALVESAFEEMGEIDGSKNLFLFGKGWKKTGVPTAVFLNAVAAHSMEYNDLYYEMPGHPSAILGPVVFTLGEMLRRTGKEILEAYLPAFEIQCRINQALLPVHHQKGFHSTSTSGVVGAALAAGKLLRLSRQQMADAVSLACTSACGLRRNFGTYTNSIHAGLAAESGVRSAFFARRGITACRDLLTEPDGYFNAFYGNQNKWKLLLNQLGEVSCFVTPGLLLKKYPACYSVYQCVDAALALREKYEFRGEDISKVICFVPELTFQSLPGRKADSAYEGRFCVPYCTAAALVTGGLDESRFSQNTIQNPEIKRLVSNTDYQVPEELKGKRGYGFSRVEVVLKDGRSLAETAFPNPRERLENWSLSDLKKKFQSCCGVSAPGMAEEFLSLETKDTVTGLLAGLVAVEI